MFFQTNYPLLAEKRNIYITTYTIFTPSNRHVKLSNLQMGGNVPIKSFDSLAMTVVLISYSALMIWVNEILFLSHINYFKATSNTLNHSESISKESADNDKNSRSPELYEIMAKQYDVPNGTYEGTPYKKILYWNHGKKIGPLHHDIGVGRNAFKTAGCPVWQCETSLDTDNMFQYDAILFRPSTWDGQTTPKGRWPHQRYIFLEWESPTWPTSGVNFFKYDDY